MVLQHEGKAVMGDCPAWLGKDKIVYNHCIPEGCGLYIMGREGTRPVFFFKSAERLAPATSPDGKWIAFSSRREGNWEIYVISVENGELKRLTENEANDWLPTWSPDGKRIAFLSDRDGAWAIWAISSDGTELSRLFSLEGSPDGHVRDEPEYNSQGWMEERISWSP